MLAGNGPDALWRLGEETFDVVVLDAMIPAPDGVEVCRRMRADGVWTPVLMLTARDGIDDRVRGLDAGADDYLTKPFALAELHARLRSLDPACSRRAPRAAAVRRPLLDPASREAWRGDVRLELSAREFALLAELVRHAGQVLSRSHLLDHVWDVAYEGDSNVVDVYVRYLRLKVDRPFGRASLETVRGAGYRLVDDAAQRETPAG